MRRALVTALAVPVLMLSACGGDEPEVEDVQTTEEETTSEEPTTEEETTEEETTSEEPTEEETTEDETTEDETGDAAAETDDNGSDAGAEGDGQAAADRTKEWLVAFVNGEEAVCDMMLDLESEGPMKDDPASHQLCLDTFPSMASSMFDTEMVGIIESMEINGADVTGDTAIVDKDNFSPMFAEGMGEEVITLKMIDDEWYVDMNASFESN